MALAVNPNDYAVNGYATPATGFFARLRQAFADYRVYLQTRNELEALSDRELADLGIARLSIDEVARGATYRA